MIPAQPIITSIPQLLIADPTTFAPPLFVRIALVKQPFTPGPNLVLADVTLADFTGTPTLTSPTAAGIPGINPQTGGQTVGVSAPAGGYYFLCTGAPLIPQTIYGFVAINLSTNLLIASDLLVPQFYAVPPVISAVGHFVSIPDPRIEFPPTPAF